MDNLSINGFGSSNGGTFHSVELNGKGTINGDVNCEQFFCNGSGTVNGRIKTEAAKISGHAKMNGNIDASSLRIDGSAKIEGDISAAKLKVAGYAGIDGHVKGDELIIRGKASISKDCEVEHFSAEGLFTIDGLLNAEQIDIKLHGGESKVKEIGGRQISCTPHQSKILSFLAPLFSSPKLTADLIEGDQIELTHTTAKIVRGNSVFIGENCDIEMIEYKEEFQQAKTAKVGDSRKI
ncbi:polymer-forming cytoskeletal protein [Bacillus changyiensis]|uniref:polymer-forming cytoskeletal protein n=1 Tax=Bacillus changyiensis TaxID=3004103 RepID=UPI0022E6C475|nr:polymer-forming cytoskeletal protein [Bacillus changyiensis]MDA1476121.1 polymer-forming cytoskeletal protein [Bacillus changyiensis]